MKPLTLTIHLLIVIVIFLSGCNEEGIPKDDFVQALDSMDGSKAPTFAPIWKKRVLAVYNKKHDEVARLEYLSDKDQFVAESGKLKKTTTTLADKLDKMLASERAMNVSDAQRRQTQQLIDQCRKMSAIIEDAGDNADNLLHVSRNSFQSEIVVAYYEQMRSGKMVFADEMVAADNGICHLKIGATTYTYHFVRTDGEWKFDVVKTIAALNDLMAEISAQLPE